MLNPFPYRLVYHYNRYMLQQQVRYQFHSLIDIFFFVVHDTLCCFNFIFIHQQRLVLKRDYRVYSQ